MRGLGAWESVPALPHPELRPGVLRYHGYRLELPEPVRRLEVPVGAVTLVLGFGPPVRLLRADGTRTALVSVASGLATAPTIGEHGGRVAGVEILLSPWAAFRLLDVDSHELAERCVDPGQLPHGARFTRLASALAGRRGWAERFAVLDSALRRWWRTGPAWSPRVEHAWRLLERSGGAAAVGAVAREVGWSPRQLQSRFREQIGLPPKAAARVLRLQRVSRLLTSGLGQAETAALCGFYDQSHLSTEFHAMTGRTPGEFVLARGALRAADGAGGPHRDRLGGAVTSLVLRGGGRGAQRPSGGDGGTGGSERGRTARFSKTVPFPP